MQLLNRADPVTPDAVSDLSPSLPVLSHLYAEATTRIQERQKSYLLLSVLLGLIITALCL